MPVFTVAHLSDLHLSDPPWCGRLLLSPKRALAFLAWRLKKRWRHDRGVLDAAARDVRELEPDAVIVTGDLTQLGLPSEYREVRDWLPMLGPTSRVAVVPGNHDLTRVDARVNTLDLWTPWMRAADANGGTAAFPTLHEVGDLALIGLSSALPSGLFFATGKLGQAQVDLLGDVLQRTGRAGRFRVVFLHHPPCDGIVRKRKRLIDASLLRSVLDRHGVELLLHGHAHRPLQNWARIAGRATPVIGAPSVSETGRGPPRYNVYRVSRSGGSWEVRMAVRAFSAGTAAFGPERSERLSEPTDGGAL